MLMIINNFYMIPPQQEGHFCALMKYIANNMNTTSFTIVNYLSQ